MKDTFIILTFIILCTLGFITLIYMCTGSIIVFKLVSKFSIVVGGVACLLVIVRHLHK